MNTSDITRIVDLGEATALLTMGFTLVKLEPSNTGKHKIFVFESMHPNTSTNFVTSIVEDYNRRRLTVDAYSFFRAGKELKNKIHEFEEINARS